MDQFSRSQTSHSDVRRQKNKAERRKNEAKQGTGDWSKRLLGFGVMGALLVGPTMGGALPSEHVGSALEAIDSKRRDAIPTEHVDSNHHLPESRHLTDSPPALPDYLRELDKPSWHFIGPKDAHSTREFGKDTSQSLNEKNDGERIPQGKEFHKIILACQNPEFVKVCIALANKQGFMEYSKQNKHHMEFLCKLCEDPELARDCIALANNQEVMGNLKQDKHFMKFLSELCKNDPEFILTSIALAKNNKPLDNGYPPLNVTDVKGNLNDTQGEAHSQNSDTMQENVKSQKWLGRKLLNIQESEERTAPQDENLAETIAKRFIDTKLPQRQQQPFIEKVATEQLRIAEKHLDHTNRRDDIMMGMACAIAFASVSTLFFSNYSLNNQLRTAKGDRRTVIREIEELKRTWAEPKKFEDVRKELEDSKREQTRMFKDNQDFVQKNDVLIKEKANLEKQEKEWTQAAVKFEGEAGRLRLQNDNLQEKVKKLEEENSKLKNMYSDATQKYTTLYTSYQQIYNSVPPHQRDKQMQLPGHAVNTSLVVPTLPSLL